MKYYQCIGLRDEFGQLREGYPKFIEAAGAEGYYHSRCPDLNMYIFDVEEPEFEGDDEPFKESRICHALSGYAIARGLTRDLAIKDFERILEKHGISEIQRRTEKAFVDTGVAPA